MSLTLRPVTVVATDEMEETSEKSEIGLKLTVAALGGTLSGRSSCCICCCREDRRTTCEDGIWGKGGGGGGAGIEEVGAGILGEMVETCTGEEIDAEGIFRRDGSSTSTEASMETVMLVLADDLLFPIARMLLNTL